MSPPSGVCPTYDDADCRILIRPIGKRGKKTKTPSFTMVRGYSQTTTAKTRLHQNLPSWVSLWLIFGAGGRKLKKGKERKGERGEGEGKEEGGKEEEEETVEEEEVLLMIRLLC